MAIAVSAILVSSAAEAQSFQIARGSKGVVEETVIVPTKELHKNTAKDIAQLAKAESQVEARGSQRGSYVFSIGEEYSIGAGDTLDFRSFNDPGLSSSIRVRFDGYISLPLIPDLNVLNATRKEATDKVRDAYSEIFTAPQISLSIIDVQSKSFFVIGDVSRPAEYAYTKPISLLQAVYTAGGLRINTQGGDSFVGAQGQLVSALIIRKEDGEREVTDYDLRNLDQPGAHASDTPVYPGDIVYIPEGVNLVYIMGEVQRPTVRQLTTGMTLVQLLVQSGGHRTDTARLQHVVLIRETDDENTRVQTINVRKIFKTGQDIVLQAGDMIYIPERRLVRLGSFVRQFTGTISPLLSLYNQAYETYYTDKRLRQFYDSDDGIGSAVNSGDIAALQRLLGELGSLPPFGTP